MRLEAKGGAVDVGEDTSRALAAKYPAVDVDGELLKMHLWLLTNPGGRPVKIWRFVDNWLRRAKPKSVAVLKVARVSNINDLCGRGNGHTGGVDGTPVCLVARAVRQPDDDHVGRLSAG